MNISMQTTQPKQHQQDTQATHKQFISFLFAGGIAAAANYSSRFIFNIWFSYEVSIILAYLVGMAVAFVLMRRHVFTQHEATDNTTQRLAVQIGKFALVNLLAVLQTLLISIVLVRYFFPQIGVTLYPEAIAHLIGVLVPAVTSYIGHKFFTFR